MNDRTTRFGTFTCTHRSKHWIKAIATHPPPIHHTTPHHTTPPPGPSWPKPVCIQSRRVANCVTRCESYRYNAQSRLYVPLRDSDTGDNGKSTNSEQSGTRSLSTPPLPPSTLLTTLFGREKGLI